MVEKSRLGHGCRDNCNLPRMSVLVLLIQIPRFALSHCLAGGSSSWTMKTLGRCPQPTPSWTCSLTLQRQRPWLRETMRNLGYSSLTVERYGGRNCWLEGREAHKLVKSRSTFSRETQHLTRYRTLSTLYSSSVRVGTKLSNARTIVRVRILRIYNVYITLEQLY